MFHELTSRDREDGHATGQAQGFASEAYLNSTSQGAKPEHALKDAHIRGRSRPFMKYPGYIPRWVPSKQYIFALSSAETVNSRGLKACLK